MYQPLLNSAEEEYKPPLSPLRDTERPHRPIFTLRDLIAAPSLFFALSCFLSLAISAVNISFLSAHDAFDTYATARKPVRSPSIYPGLENVHWSTPRCRNHTVYPRSYAQIEDKSRRHKLVHAYRDEVTFAFGGEVCTFPTHVIMSAIPTTTIDCCRYCFQRSRLWNGELYTYLPCISSLALDHSWTFS